MLGRSFLASRGGQGCGKSTKSEAPASWKRPIWRKRSWWLLLACYCASKASMPPRLPGWLWWTVSKSQSKGPVSIYVASFQMASRGRDRSDYCTDCFLPLDSLNCCPRSSGIWRLSKGHGWPLKARLSQLPCAVRLLCWFEGTAMGPDYWS